MNAVLGTMNLDTSSVIDQTHPPVIKTMRAQGANGVIPEGTLAALNAGGNVVAFVRGGAAPLNVCIGVFAKTIDTASDDAAPIVRHGTVVQSKLLTGAVAPNAAEIAALETLGVFPR